MENEKCSHFLIPYGFSSFRPFVPVCCLRAWVRLVSVTSPKRMVGRSSARIQGQLLCAARQTSVVGRKHEMLETAAEYNFDTVSNATKIKILLPLCVNDDFYTILFNRLYSSWSCIPTEHFSRHSKVSI